MKLKSSKSLTLLVAGSLVLTLSAFEASKKPWVVPDKFAKMANPHPSNPESLKEGKELYAKHCQSCHGKSGHGDGTKAATLKTDPGNFAKGDFQHQSDGSLFYKISEGRDDMPNFKKKISDPTEIWSVVNYVRTLNK